MIIVLDLILHKSQVYRHLIFNRMPAYDRGIDPNLVYMALLLLFCDGYHKFSRLRALPCLPDNTIPPGAASTTPRMHIDSPLEFFDWDMLFCLGLSAFQLSLYLLGIIGGARMRFNPQIKPNYLVMCVLASSFGKALYLLMMIWDYPPSFSDMIEWFILSSNVVALRTYFHPVGDLWSAGFVVCLGWLTRRAVGWLVAAVCQQFFLVHLPFV